MFNIFSTLKQGASSAANTVGGFAGTINQNLQNFGGDVYDTYAGAKQGVQQAYGQAKGAVQDYGSTIARNVSDASSNFQKRARDLNYRAWDTVMKNTPTWEETKTELNKNTGGYDRAKLENIFSDMASKGYTQEQAMEVVAEIDRRDPSFLQSKSYGDKIRQSIAARGDEFGKTYKDYSSGKIGFGEAALRNAGDILGTAGGVIGNTITEIPGVEPTLKAVGGVVSAIPGVKQGAQAYGEFAQNNPRFAENLQAIGNIGATALGSTQGQAMIAKGVSKAGEGIKKVAEPVIEKASPYVQKGVSIASNKIDDTINNVKDVIRNRNITIGKIRGLEPQEIGALRNVGEEQVVKTIKKMGDIEKNAIEGGGVTNIYDDLHNNIMKGVGERSRQLGKLEEARKMIVDTSPATYKTKELLDIFDNQLSENGIKRVGTKYKIIGEGDIQASDLATLERFRKELTRGMKGNLTAKQLDERIKNLQNNLYSKATGEPTLGSESVARNAESIVAKANDLLKSRLPEAYSVNKSKQSAILNTRKELLKKLGEEDNMIARMTDSQLARLGEKDFTKLLNDSIAGNKMALFLRRLASSTTTGGDAKQLANIVKSFTGVDAESQAIALRAIARMTDNKQILSELGGLLEQGPVNAVIKGAGKLAKKVLLPSDEKILKNVAKTPIIKPKASPKK